MFIDNNILKLFFTNMYWTNNGPFRKDSWGMIFKNLGGRRGGAKFSGKSWKIKHAMYWNMGKIHICTHHCGKFVCS